MRPVVLLERDLKHKDSNSLPLLTEVNNRKLKKRNCLNFLSLVQFEDGAKLAKLIYNRVQKEDCKMKVKINLKKN